MWIRARAYLTWPAALPNLSALPIKGVGELDRYRAAGWRDSAGTGTWTWTWTWHSLWHVFCKAALFSWRLEATDVSCMAGHANVRVTLDMSVRRHRRHPGPPLLCQGRLAGVKSPTTGREGSPGGLLH